MENKSAQEIINHTLSYHVGWSEREDPHFTFFVDFLTMVLHNLCCDFPSDLTVKSVFSLVAVFSSLCHFSDILLVFGVVAAS